MKPSTLPAGFPNSSEEWNRLIAEAPSRVDDTECPYDPNDPEAVEAAWKDAVPVRGGGPAAVRQALARRRAERNGTADRVPAKVPATILFDADVFAALKASGTGWQARVNDAMRKWLNVHSVA
uniref:BrnA antitoxin of type II toxin-antitoxin system n=1 Tax=Candidatus Kentrum sp. FM TaxID=2126340 RepID=A0A450U1A7_9GAMM|nr:MAG: BrnA antitoxin of type II toxin-antitoxin system [Candidatus Kentron sp. FM]VFJ76633.1 MAG: BrnA antitoxin of type II toxin-antitoxin system [Candidatus Kentron sp. FM]VFK17068.1 MAG: BrnA antitoxin of type II toxin-antitoxin system [Candidatus Kentron sp. FM]